MMRELAIKVVGLRTLFLDFLDRGDMDVAFEYQEELVDTAHALADEVLAYDPLDGHTRLFEISQYASRRGVCIHEAIVELVNAALSHGLDKQ
jgi:hypothetical protein